MSNGNIRNRACVIGLDGMPCFLLDELCDRGVMPAVDRLRRQIGSRTMKASLPEISAVSWTCFATGANPGVHGIFGFVDLKPRSYDLRFPSFLDCRAPTIWDKVGAAGGNSIVINQPFTYPARAMQGNLISGFVALDLEHSVHPPELLPVLRESGYKIDIDTVACRANHDLIWRQLDETLESRRKAVDLLWEEDWDYFEVVITGTDRLFHYLWDAVEEPDHPQHERVLEYFRAIDRFIDDMVKRFNRKEGGNCLDRFFLISDHGFRRIESEINVNRWLIEQGYLAFENDRPAQLSEIKKGSRAFCLDPGRIYINIEGKYPMGCVRRDEARQLAKEIGDRFLTLTHNDKPVIRRALLREEVYAGPYAEPGPDLLLLSNYGFDLKGSLAADTVFSTSDLKGMHTWDDAVIITGAETPPNVFIWDLSAIILKSMGIG